ncbi:MAG TPA: Crp/Fnr family transcriptional regulator, partial [Nitrospiraceae bacterium]
MTTLTAQLEKNRLLACLPARERNILNEHLDVVSLRPKEELNGVGSPVRHLHFPIDSAISLMDFKPDGGVVEVALIGKEGCTGSTAVQGSKNALCRVLVQVGGSALRVRVPSVLKALPQLPFFRFALSRFTTTILRATIVSVGCSQFHSVEQRLGRWFLAHQDRTGASVFPFTHDFLAEQLGVQRATVSEA